MRKSFLFTCIGMFVSFQLAAQIPIQNARKQSWQQLVYRITADTAEKYLGLYVLPLHHYLDEQPFTTWKKDSAKYDELPLGNYLILSAEGNQLTAQYYCQSRLRVFPLNNQYRVQLEVKGGDGRLADGARLWINKKEIAYNEGLGTFQLKGKKPGEAVIRITAPGDTLLMELSALEDLEKNGWQQWWAHYPVTKTGKVLTWPVKKVEQLFKPGRHWSGRRFKASGSLNKGYMVFNKPRYMPGDTVRLKAYILNKKGRQYRKSLDLYLQYNKSDMAVDKKMGTVQPQSPAAFVHEFVLGDSMEMDKTYTILFRDRKRKILFRGNFLTEDYLLDEMATYSIRSEKETYYRPDTLVFYVGARDANGLSVMDGRVNLYLLSKNIGSFFKDRLFVPDTLWKGQQVLAVDDDTKFEIPAKDFPEGNITVSAVAEFLNSNNEMQEQETSVAFVSEDRIIDVKKEGVDIVADYRENGISVINSGFLSIDEHPKMAVRFPYRKRLDPYAAEYEFWIEDDKNPRRAVGSYEPDDRYDLEFSRIQDGDTAGFTLHNPNLVAVHYTVFYGNTIVAIGQDMAEWISWKKQLPAKKIYRVKWNYIWAGKERKGEESIAVLDKLLKTTITGAQTIYPGQADTITVSVKDYKGNAAAGVNLSAVSYNSQFKNKMQVREPPYLKIYRSRNRILFDNYELDDAGFIRHSSLGQDQGWIQKLGLDSMLYYQLLFPVKEYAIASQLVSDFTPQLAVHVTSKGEPQEIYMLYLNREFVFYRGVTDKSKYAFPVMPGYIQIGFRLKDKYVQIDSIYIQPFYKHDIAFDLDHLPANASVEERPLYFTALERNQIEGQLLQVQSGERMSQAYIWQENKLVFLAGTNTHLVGPFRAYDSLQFYKPADFDLKFSFEPGYDYRISPSMARLEKRSIFSAETKKIMLPKLGTASWILGDTILATPKIRYDKKQSLQFLKASESGYAYPLKRGMGQLKALLPTDSSFIYGILYSKRSDTTILRIKDFSPASFTDILPGKYSLVLVTRGYHYLVAEDLSFIANGTLCIKFTNPMYQTNSALVSQLMQEYTDEMDIENARQRSEENKNNSPVARAQQRDMPAGHSIISGRITDKIGKTAIPGATVLIEGYLEKTTAQDGGFVFSNIRSGRYTLVIYSIGYASKKVVVNTVDGITTNIDIQLEMSQMRLEEVVVVGYGTARKKEFSGSISIINAMDISQTLSGRMAGVSITGEPGNSANIRIRGMNSIDVDSKPIYVVDGILMDELPADIDMSKAQMSVMAGNSATALYGSRAINGAIVINTSAFTPKLLRDQFRDYAFWQANLVTDENGQVKFRVVYPDNITGWQTYVVGMDKKRRITKAGFFTKAFKPLLAQLSAPSFLVEGDSSVFIGKATNYTQDATAIVSDFQLNNSSVKKISRTLGANGSLSDPLPVIANSTDTITAQYTLTNGTAYSDGESRRIPVFRKGIEETVGTAWILDKDTSFSFVPDKNAGNIIIHAQDNTLDVLLDELRHLKEYPYFCMEQTASKLTGLLMEMKIKEYLRQRFTEEKQVQQLVEKLQKAQLFDGGWSWWPGGQANLTVTNYVLRTLLDIRKDAQVEISVRNGLLYLQNRLPVMRRPELVSALFTLSNAGHEMNYSSYVEKIRFDSLSIYEQWEMIQVKRNLKMEYKTELNKVLARKTETMLGGLYWGNNSYDWESNGMAATVLAYKILEEEKAYPQMLKKIIRYFLGQRKNGIWNNTVESANTVAAILPAVLSGNSSFQQPPVLNISNGNIIRQDSFPFTQTIANNVQPITINRSGGGIVYLTAWQKIFNPNPVPVTDKFLVQTYFEKSGSPIASLKTGEKATMKINIEVTKDADYVAIEVPIPAGCTYADKENRGWMIHKEFLKNKVILFVETMKKGKYSYEIQLEPRYSGVYQLNPSKAELMYFPLIYGRNGVKSLEIKN